MRWNCKSHGGVICIKNVNYGGTYVPKEEERAKETKKPTGDNALDAIKEDIARIQDELIKQNRDNLDAMYNLDMDNFSASFRKTFGNALSEFKLIADDTKAQFEALAQWKTDTTNSIASIRGTANANSATLESIASWQDETNRSISSVRQTADSASATATMASQTVGTYGSRIAAVETKASKTETSVTNLVSAIGEDGSELKASITVGIKNDTSFIEAIAEEVKVSSDLVTLTSLKGTTGVTINGSLVRLFMDGTEDTGTNKIEGSSIQFMYGKSVSNYVTLSGSKYAAIWTKCDQGDTDTTSRYAMNLETYSFTNSQNDYVYPAIKISAAGRVSMSGQAIYMNANSYITQEGDAVIIRGATTLQQASYINHGDYDIVFCKGGIMFCYDGDEYIMEYLDGKLYFDGRQLAFV